MEYAGPAPAAYDIANHFVEHVGADGKLLSVQLLSATVYFFLCELSHVWYCNHFDKYTAQLNFIRPECTVIQ